MGTLICRLLGNLAAKSKSHGAEHDRLVLASIHGPSGRMLSCFTHLLVLTDHGGRVAYHGPTQDAEAFFTAALGGKARPPDFNAAEFLLNSVSDMCVDNDGTSSTNSDLLVHSDDPARVAAAFDQLQVYHKVALPGVTSHVRPAFCCKSARRVSLFTLFKANLWRLWLEVSRTPGMALVLATNAVVMGGMFGVLYYQQVVSSWRNTMCMVFALMVRTFWACRFGCNVNPLIPFLLFPLHPHCSGLHDRLDARYVCFPTCARTSLSTPLSSFRRYLRTF